MTDAATTAIGVGLLAVAWLILFAEAMNRPLNHDEFWFLAVANLLRSGLVPYRDMPCLHPPNFFLLAAPLATAGGFLTLLGRLITVTAAVATAALVGHLVRRDAEENGRVPAAAVLGVAAATVVAYSPLLAMTAGRATNYVLPSLAALLGLACLRPRSSGLRSSTGLVLGGVGLSMATGFRLAYVGAVVAVTVLLVAERRIPVGRRLRSLGAFSVGCLAGGLPSLVLFSLAPGRFWFGTVEYHTLQQAFHESYGWDHAMDLGGKLWFLLADVIARQPANLLLAVGFATVLGIVLRSRRLRLGLLNALAPTAAAIALGLLITAELPTPTWEQYLFAPLPFAVVAMFVVLGRLLDGSRRAARGSAALATLVAAGTLVLAIPRTGQLPQLFRPESWAPVLTHELGAWAAEHSGGLPIATLAPIVAVEGGAAIDPAFATGPFVWRVAHHIDPDRRRRLGIVSRDDLEEHFSSRPPVAFLLGFDEPLEGPLVGWARGHGYRPLPGPARFVLWLPPGPASSPVGAIR